MTIQARVYITVVVLAGIAILGSCPWVSDSGSDWTRFWVYLALAVLASGMKVRLPGIRGTCSLNFVVYLLAVAQLTLAEAVYIVCAGSLVQTVWRTTKRPKAVQVAFNIAAMIVSIVPPIMIYDRWPGLPTLALSAALFYTLNTALVSSVIALTQQQTLFQVWNVCYFWTLPYYLLGALVAAGADASRNQFGWNASLLLLPLMYMVYRHYRLVVAGQVPTTGGHMPGKTM